MEKLDEGGGTVRAEVADFRHLSRLDFVVENPAAFLCAARRRRRRRYVDFRGGLVAGSQVAENWMTDCSSVTSAWSNHGSVATVVDFPSAAKELDDSLNDLRLKRIARPT